MKHRIHSRRRYKLAAVAIGLAVAAGFVFLAPVEGTATRIVTAADIERSPSAVFSFVTTPGNWPRWHPSSIAVSGAVDHPLDVGESVVEDFEVAGRRGRVTWSVIAREPDRSWRIAGTIDGRKAGTVSYSLAPTASGTQFVREFEYRTPTLFFTLLNRLSLRARIEAESQQAVRQLKECLEPPMRSACADSSASATR